MGATGPTRAIMPMNVIDDTQYDLIDDVDKSSSLPVYTNVHYLVGVAGINALYHVDLRSLQGNFGWLTDKVRFCVASPAFGKRIHPFAVMLVTLSQVMNGVTWWLCRRVNWLPVDSYTLTSIMWDGHVRFSRGRPLYLSGGGSRLTPGVTLAGPLLQGGVHWTLVVINTDTGTAPPSFTACGRCCHC